MTRRCAVGCARFLHKRSLARCLHGTFRFNEDREEAIWKQTDDIIQGLVKIVETPWVVRTRTRQGIDCFRDIRVTFRQH
jgi:hypothetical protein